MSPGRLFMYSFTGGMLGMIVLLAICSGWMSQQ